MEKQTNYFVDDYKTWIKNEEKEYNKLSGSIEKYAISIEKSGTKIEMVQVTVDNDGKVNENKFYMTKEEK